MTTFLQVCLYAFALCAGGAMIACLILAAKAGQKAAAGMSVLVAALVMFVLIASAVMLP